MQNKLKKKFFQNKKIKKIKKIVKHYKSKFNVVKIKFKVVLKKINL